MRPEDDETEELALRLMLNQDFVDVRACEHACCNQAAFKCELPGEGDQPDTYFWYCQDHAARNGFCTCCGTFIAGYIETDAMCEHCRDQIDQDKRDLPEDGDGFWPDSGVY